MIDRAVLAIAAIGKFGFFGVPLLSALADTMPLRLAFNATPDLLFALIFAWWLRRPRHVSRHGRSIVAVPGRCHAHTTPALIL